MVRSGCIKEIDGYHTDQVSVANFYLPGELLILQCADAARSHTTSLAVEASFICAVPWRIVERACTATSGVAGELISLVTKAGAATRELLMMIRGKEALQRVAGFLLNMCERIQFHGPRGRDFRLRMSRDDIANYLGLRSETVSRCFSELGRRGLIRVRAKRVHILAPAELRHLFLDEETEIDEM